MPTLAGMVKAAMRAAMAALGLSIVMGLVVLVVLLAGGVSAGGAKSIMQYPAAITCGLIVLTIVSQIAEILFIWVMPDSSN
jgi:hypothetical protein